MPKQEELIQVSTVNVDRIGPNGYQLTTVRPFEFIPGQVVKLTSDHSLAPRLYSIASGNKETTLKFLFDLKTDGELTPLLSKLMPGDKIWMSKPFGEFTCDNEPAVWVASGTGIAPFLSMAFSGNTNNKKLIHGGRNEENFSLKMNCEISLVTVTFNAFLALKGKEFFTAGQPIILRRTRISASA